MKALLILVLAGIATFGVHAQERPTRGASGPASSLSLILGKPTDRSIILSVLSATAIEARVEYGVSPGAYSGKTEARTLQAGVPFEFELGSLKPDTRYGFRLFTRPAEARDFRPEPEGVFHTQRAPGSAFTFAVQGDSHPEREKIMYDPGLYLQTLRNVATNPPDFYLTLGDDFSIERLIGRQMLGQSAVDRVYAFQRTFLDLVGRSAPLFLVNGNHEQAALCNLDGTADNPAVLAGRARSIFFPLPAPDAFYGGDAEKVTHVGLLRDYYSWTWGDALFVVIDPYWHSPVPVDNKAGEEGRQRQDGQGDGKKRDLWDVTLGDAQYRWLVKTLTESRARWKFVFAHHVLGTGRGGIEFASLGEWGGKNRRGEDQFGQKRPGWEMPVHQLMVKTGVTIFFQGHDHLFARQELDGVVYQSCPNPADPTYQAFNRDSYRSGDILPNSGHVRVTVSPAEVNVDYIRSWRAEDETAGHTNGEVGYHYTIPAKQASAQPFSLILGRPTRTSVTISALTSADGEAFIRYGSKTGMCTNVTPTVAFKAGEAKEVVIESLAPDTLCFYQFWYRSGVSGAFNASAEYSFHTQRAAGSPFTFTVTADSHLDENTDPEVYAQTLRNALGGRPDFHIDLGDTFMTGKRRDRPEDALPQYQAQRGYFSLLCAAAPLFLALGNHDGECGPRLDEATRMRTAFFPNPVPDAFYSGSTNGNYYAWHWGDALFVVLDPFRYALPAARGGDIWNFTLGRPQYDWLRKTLESSAARYKLVFIHHLVGGLERQGRGGAEAVSYGEWGGCDPDGRDAFAEKRPGWPMPIHALLVKHGVTAVFHGHDHFFAKQQVDGIVYQLVPQPGHPGEGSIRQAEEYGYRSGDKRAGSGFLRVTVVSSEIAVDFVRTGHPANGGAAVADSVTYTIPGMR